MITQSKKLKIWRRDNFTCTYCSKESSNKTVLTVDHILPREYGGDNTTNNLTTACRGCNKKKGSLLLTQFIDAFKVKITPKIASFL